MQDASLWCGGKPDALKFSLRTVGGGKICVMRSDTEERAGEQGIPVGQEPPRRSPSSRVCRHSSSRGCAAPCQSPWLAFPREAFEGSLSFARPASSRQRVNISRSPSQAGEVWSGWSCGQDCGGRQGRPPGWRGVPAADRHRASPARRPATRAGSPGRAAAVLPEAGWPARSSAPARFYGQPRRWG